MVCAASGGNRWRKIGIALFKFWHAILGHTPIDVNAMVLATVDKAREPSTRNVLLKGVDERGFVFYTNYDSRKGLELAENPNAALTFYWTDLERQVCVAGTATSGASATNSSLQNFLSSLLQNVQTGAAHALSSVGANVNASV